MLLLVVGGLAVTAALALLVRAVVADAEDRLLRQRAREAALVLEGQVAEIEAAMRSAGIALRYAGGSATPLVVDALTQESPFAAAALVQVEPFAVLAESGTPLHLLRAEPQRAMSALREVTPGGGSSVVALLGRGDDRRLGVARRSEEPGVPVLYGELPLPDRPGSALREDVAFSDVLAAVYLSSAERPDEVLLSTTADLPIDGPRSSVPVPFGSSRLWLVLAARDHLVGSLAAALPWAVLAVGMLGTAGAAGAVHATGRRRDEALRHAAELRDARGQLERLNADLERQVEARTADLSASNRELEAFAYSVSHDLRTPLRAIDGFTTALVEDHGEALAPEAHDHLDRVRAAARRMGHLIDDLLALSRVTRQPLEREPVDLSADVRAVAAELAERHPRRRVDLEVSEGVVVDGDRGLLRVVLENLLANAWKFTAGRDPARIRFGAECTDGVVTCEVADDGAGFDPAHADKLFRPFQRLHRQDEFEGSGVGLATVARIVERHGGRVWAEGVVGGGATVRFTLPGAPVGAAPADPEAPSAGRTGAAVGRAASR